MYSKRTVIAIVTLIFGLTFNRGGQPVERPQIDLVVSIMENVQGRHADVDIFAYNIETRTEWLLRGQPYREYDPKLSPGRDRLLFQSERAPGWRNSVVQETIHIQDLQTGQEIHLNPKFRRAKTRWIESMKQRGFNVSESDYNFVDIFQPQWLNSTTIGFVSTSKIRRIEKNRPTWLRVPFIYDIERDSTWAVMDFFHSEFTEIYHPVWLAEDTIFAECSRWSISHEQDTSWPGLILQKAEDVSIQYLEDFDDYVLYPVEVYAKNPWKILMDLVKEDDLNDGRRIGFYTMTSPPQLEVLTAGHHPTLSPDRRRIAYIFEGDLYLYHLETEEIERLTDDALFRMDVHWGTHRTISFK